MVRTVTVPEDNNIHLVVPDEYIGKKIEILFYSLDEVTANEHVGVLKSKLSSRFIGVLNKKQGQDLDQHLKQIRDEWGNI